MPAATQSSPAGTARRERVPSAATSGFITWAQETSFTDNYWSREVEEAWVVLWPEHLGSEEFLAGVDLAAFAADYTGDHRSAVSCGGAASLRPSPPRSAPRRLLPPSPPVPPRRRQAPTPTRADVALAHAVTVSGRTGTMSWTVTGWCAGALPAAWLAAKQFVSQV